MGVKTFDVMNLGRVGLLDPEQMGYKDSIDIIKDESIKIQKSFVKIGWYLKHIRDNELYKEEGYSNIWECAADQLGYSQSTASRFINICEKFSKDHNSPELDEKYIGFDKSQMIEMLPMQEEQLEKVTPDMTVKQIRDIKAEKMAIQDVDVSNLKEEKETENIPGQTNIEENFPEYLPDSYATSHKKEYSHEENDNKTSIEQASKKCITGFSKYGVCSCCGYEGIQCCAECEISCNSRCGWLNEKQENEFVEDNIIVGKVNDIDNQELILQQSNSFTNNTDNLEMAKYVLKQEKELLESYLKTSDTPELNKLKLKQKVIVTALETMVNDLEFTQKPSCQPELMILKNNEQRKEWLNNYKDWGLWYRDEHINVNYYKYDFEDGSRLVVAEYTERFSYWTGEREDKYYYHLLEKNRKGYNKVVYDEVYRHETDSETYLVDFLKNLQKGNG